MASTEMKIKIDWVEVVQESWAAAFNRWMDDYTANPDGYSTTERDAMEYLRERLGGEEPSYGQRCAAALAEYLAQGK